MKQDDLQSQFMEAWVRQNRLDQNKLREDVFARAGTPNVWSPGFSRFVWRFTRNVSLQELALAKCQRTGRGRAALLHIIRYLLS